MHIRKNVGAVAVVFLMVVMGQVTSGMAQNRTTDEIPKIILSGLEAYKAEGPEAALKAWIKGSPIDGSKEALTQANSLRQIQDFYGGYKAFDVISTRNLSPNIRIVYLALNFEKGPLFARFVTYQTTQGWILTTFDFNTKDQLILPPSL